MLLLLLTSVAFAAYKFFFAPDPEKEGATAASKEYNCNEQRTAAWPAIYQAFITASANRSFISNDEIVACVDSLASAAERAYDSCSGEARNFYAASYKKNMWVKSSICLPKPILKNRANAIAKQQILAERFIVAEMCKRKIAE